MRHRWILLLCAGLLLVSGATGGVAADGNVTIEQVAPNPISPENDGEYVVLHAATPRNLSGYRLSDGTHAADLPNRTIEGAIAVSEHPRVTQLLTDLPVDGWDGHAPLASGGGDVRLLDPAGHVVDDVSYGETAEGTRWIRANDGGLTTSDGPSPGPFPPRSVRNVTGFVLPDSPQTPIELLEEAEERIWLSGYQFTDPAIARVIAERHGAGVDVQVLLDGQPVGGQSATERVVLDRVAAAGIPITVLTGERRRFRYHHPKYAVIDDTVIVLSENWKPNGTGGASSRGWGIAVENAAIATDLATIFETDARWRDRLPWEQTAPSPVLPDVTTPMPVDAHEAMSLPAERVEIAAAPDDAMDRVDALLANATESIRIQQVRIGSLEFPLLQRALNAAARGVDVQIQVDGSRYVAEENAVTVDRLRTIADRDGLPLTVEMADGGRRFGKIHNKGVIVDEESVVVGSMNWNDVSATANREVIAIAHGDAVGEYYANVFDRDLVPPTGEIPVGFVATVIGLWTIGGVLARRRVTFESA